MRQRGSSASRTRNSVVVASAAGGTTSCRPAWSPSSTRSVPPSAPIDPATSTLELGALPPRSPECAQPDAKTDSAIALNRNRWAFLLPGAQPRARRGHAASGNPTTLGGDLGEIPGFACSKAERSADMPTVRDDIQRFRHAIRCSFARSC